MLPAVRDVQDLLTVLTHRRRNAEHGGEGGMQKHRETSDFRFRTMDPEFLICYWMM